MKKLSVSLALLSGVVLLSSCGTTGGSVAQGVGQVLMNGALNGSSSSSSSSSSTSSASTSVLGSLLSGLLSGSSTLSQSDLVGTWSYSGSNCAFESENLLAKAGGAIAANKIESELNTQLAKVGIKQGACSFTFNKDNTYTATIGGRTLQGTYTLDAKNKKIKMTYLAGLASMTPRITKQGNSVNLLIESSKLLTLMKGASVLAKGTSLSGISSILNNYEGMYIGLQLKK